MITCKMLAEHFFGVSLNPGMTSVLWESMMFSMTERSVRETCCKQRGGDAALVYQVPVQFIWLDILVGSNSSSPVDDVGEVY